MIKIQYPALERAKSTRNQAKHENPKTQVLLRVLKTLDQPVNAEKAAA